MTKTLDEVTTELDLTEIRVEVGFPDTPFGGVQAFGIGDSPIQVVFGNEPGEESPETPTPPTGEGIPGPQGPPGPKGDPGEAGPPGPPGADGEAGAKGAQGIQGEPGATGATGGQGVPGAAGPQGVQGNPGPTGPKGADGTSVVIKGSVANAAALPPTGNTLGDLYITLDTGHGWVWGSPGQWSDVGPIQGPPGATGAAGATGAQGPAGATGPQGAKGDVGAMGPQGGQGVQGVKGDPGATGATGPQGPKGTTGNTGATGATGPQGIQGPQGNTGAQGVKGDPGAAGPQGVKGDKGDPGAQGIQGNTGLTGPQGAVGAAGPGVAAGGALGAILRKKSATDYDTEWKPLASMQGVGSGNPTVTGASQRMFGVGALLTPTFSGKVLAILNTQLATSGGFVAQCQIRFGLGAAPANGVLAVGTAIGNIYQTVAGQASDGVSFAAIITGLTVGQQYWFDFAAGATNAAAVTTAVLPVFSLVELP